MDENVKEIQVDFSMINQKVKSYFASIKQLEQQFGKISVELDQCLKDALSRNIVKNSNSDNRCIVVTTWISKIIVDHTMPIVYNNNTNPTTTKEKIVILGEKVKNI